MIGSCRQFLLLAIVWGPLLLWAPTSLAQETPTEPAPAASTTAPPASNQPLRFRRVYVPADRFDKLAKDTIPLRRERFEEMLAAFTHVPPAVENSRVDSCRLAARLTPRGLQGEGRMRILKSTEQTQYLSLAPCRLPIASAWWTEDHEELALGYGRSGGLAALIDRGGQLGMEWNLHNKSPSPAGRQFHLTLPTSPLNKLLLIVPDGQAISSSAGIVRRLEQPAASEWGWWEESLGEQESYCLLELGGTTQVTLSFDSQPPPGPTPQAPGYQQTTHYELAVRETSITSEIYLDRPVESLTHLEVAWPDDLNLLSAKWDQQELAWETLGQAKQGQRAAQIHLPAGAAAGGIPISLRLRGVALRGEGQKLPTIAVRNAYWREGLFTVRLLEPLALAKVELDRCVQEHHDSQTTRSDQQAKQPPPLAFRLLDEQAEVRLDTQLQQPTINALTATLFDFDPEGMRGKLHAQLSSSQGKLFRVAARLGTQWTIDSVEATVDSPTADQPVDALRDWNVVATRGRWQMLEIRLAQPLEPDRPLDLTIAAHQRNTALEGTVSLQQLNFLELEEVNLGQYVYGWQTDSSLRLDLAIPGSARLIEREELTGSLGTWFSQWETTGSYPLLLVGEHTPPATQLSLSRAKPRYTSAVASHWLIGAESLSVSHTIDCQPQSGSISQLRVRTSSQSGPPLQWSIQGESNVTVTAGLLHEDLQGAIWELGIYPPRAGEFTLVAQRQLARQGTQRLGLLTLPEAVAQTAVVEVEAVASEVSYRLRPRDLMTAPVVAAPDNRQRLYSRYRYHTGGSPQLDLTSDSTLAQTELLQIWKLQLHSLVTSQQVRHTAQYTLENRGSEHFSATLPPDVKLTAVLVNGVKTPTAPLGEDRQLSLRLPADQQFIRVSLVYQEPPCEAWSLWRHVTAKLPSTPWPALEADWLLEASPEIALWEQSDLAQQSPAKSWHEKLLGPLVGSSHQAQSTNVSADGSESYEKAHDASPWSAASLRNVPPLQNTGWAQLSLPLTAGERANIILTKPASWQLLSTILLLLGAAFSLLLCRRHARRIVLLLGLTAALGLLAPNMCSVACSGLFLGTLLAAVWLSVAQLRAHSTSAFAPSASQEASTATAANFQLMANWLMLAAGGIVCWGHAQLVAQEPPVAASLVYPVFIPVDSQQQPQGNYVHLQEDFYKALHRRYLDQQSPAEPWLLHSAQYTCQLIQVDDPALSTSPLEVEELRLEGDLHVLRSDTKLVIPLGGEQLELVEGGAFLGGNPIEPVWSEDRQGLIIAPQATGKARLDLRFRVPLISTSGRSMLKLKVPPAVQAQLQIVHPPGLQGFELLPSVPLVQKSMQRTVAELGPVSEWELEIPRGTSRDRALAAEQLTWLHLKPSATIWDVRCRYTPTVGSTSLVEWEVDPNLRLLTLSVEGAEYARHTRYTQRRLLSIQMIEPVSEPFTVEAKFIQEQSHGTGRMKLPLLRAVGAQQDRRWLAVSAAEEIDTTITHDEMVEPIVASEFVAAWEREVEPPQQAFRLLAPQPQWSVVAVLEPQGLKAQTLTTLSLDSKSVSLEHEVRVAALDEALPYYQFTIAPQFEVQAVTLKSKQGTQVLHPVVSRGHVLVRVPQPVAAEHTVKLSLSGPPPGKNYVLPTISMNQIQLTSEEYRVYRQSELQVEFPGSPPQASGFASADLLRYSPRLGRLAGLFRHDDQALGEAWPAAVVTRNDPVVQQGELVMAMLQHEGNWQLKVTLRGHVTQGQLDTIRLLAPDNLLQAAVTGGAASVETIRLPGDSRVQWVLRPREPLQEEFHLELSVPLEFEPGVSPRLPGIEVVGDQPFASYAVLPRQASNQAAAWTLTGLELTEAPALIDDQPWLPSASDSYRTGGEYSASLRLEVPQRLEPQVRLADFQLVVQANRHYYGTAAFDLEPGGLSTCLLELPPGVQLQQVLLDGSAIAMRTDKKSVDQSRNYQCLLGEANLPHRLEVLFSGRASVDQNMGADRLLLPMPRLPEVPVERTLWTIMAPDSLKLPADSSSVRAIDPQRQSSFRLQATTILAEPPTNQLATVAKGDLGSWYAPWARRLAENYWAGRELVGEQQAYEYPLDAEFLREREEMAARMGLASQFKTALSEARQKSYQPSLGQLPLIVHDPTGATHQALFAMSQGAAEQLNLKLTAPSTRPAQHGWAAGLLLIMSIGGYWLLRGRSLTEWTVWWLHPACVLIGIAWWLWLTPAAVGWVIIGITLIGSLRSPWRMRTVNQRRGFAER